MANVVRDPKEHPDAVLPDLSKADPLVKFTKDDIAFVRKQMEAALLQESGKRLLCISRAMGRYQPGLAPLFHERMERIGGPRCIRQIT